MSETLSVFRLHSFLHLQEDSERTDVSRTNISYIYRKIVREQKSHVRRVTQVSCVYSLQKESTRRNFSFLGLHELKCLQEQLSHAFRVTQVHLLLLTV